MTTPSPNARFRQTTPAPRAVRLALDWSLTEGGDLRVTAYTLKDSTGAVVPAELVPTLAEPFRRGTARVRDRDRPGVGLGLAIVRSIVAAHDGVLVLRARPDGGLRVTVELPLAAD